MEYVLPTALRLLVPLLMLRWPLPGLLLSISVDMYDWDFFDIRTPEDNAVYQNWDRIMDMYFQLVAVLMVRKWKDARSRVIAYALLGFRLVGYLLFFLTQDRKFLFFFPNFYDNFLVIYLGYVFVFKRIRLIDAPMDAIVIAVFLLIPKIIHEYFLHYLQIQPWERYDIASIFGLTGMVSYLVNSSFWGGLFYVLPFLALFLYFRWRLGDSVGDWSSARGFDRLP